MNTVMIPVRLSAHVINGKKRHLWQRRHPCGAPSSASFRGAAQGHPAPARGDPEAASPESIATDLSAQIQARGYGFRTPSLRSGSGMNSCGLRHARSSMTATVIYARNVIYAGNDICARRRHLSSSLEISAPLSRPSCRLVATSAPAIPSCCSAARSLASRTPPAA